MKMPKRAALIVLTVIAVWCLYPFRKLGWASDFGTPWRVDIETSVTRIDRVPNQLKHRFSSVKDYRNHVRELARGLTLTIHENGTASLRQGGSGSTALVWRKDAGFDYWLNTKGSWVAPVASVGHGFERISSHTAHLKFQLEWNESVATREFLLLRR